MKSASEFILPLAGLPLGETHFTYVLARPFFELYADEEVSDADVNVELVLTKHENMTELWFKMQGWLQVPCDRCGGLYRQEVTGRARLILKNSDHYEEESDEIILVPADLHEFDVSQLIYEYVVLLLPFKKVHPNDADGNSNCDPEVLARLAQMEKPESIDPRWEALRNLENLS